MAQPLYSARFLAAHNIPITAPATFVVPDGLVLVVRDIDAYSAVAGGNHLLVLLSGGPVFFQASWTPAEAGWRSWRGRQVFGPGDIVEVVAVDDVLDCMVSGYALAAP